VYTCTDRALVLAAVTLVLVGHDRLIAFNTSRRRRCCASPPSDDRLRPCCPSAPPSSLGPATATADDVSGHDSCDWGRALSRVTSGCPGRPPGWRAQRCRCDRGEAVHESTVRWRVAPAGRPGDTGSSAVSDIPPARRHSCSVSSLAPCVTVPIGGLSFNRRITFDGRG